MHPNYYVRSSNSSYVSLYICPNSGHIAPRESPDAWLLDDKKYISVVLFIVISITLGCKMLIVRKAVRVCFNKIGEYKQDKDIT